MARKTKEPTTPQQVIDLNIWKGNYVEITLSGHGHEEEVDGGVVVVPRIVKGMFVKYDGVYVHVNDIDRTPGLISISIRAELVDFVTLANPENTVYPNNDSMN